jgi:phage terminase large subunit-like protein
MNVKVKSVRKKTLQHQSVYNLKIKDNNNYFAMKFLVHNCDDPNSVRDSESDVVREGTNDWHDFVMSSRFVAPYSSFRRLVMQQRTHEKDLSGHILAKNDPSWVHLFLPMEYIPSMKSRTIPLRMSNNQVWQDKRTKENELLCPDWINVNELQEIKEKDFRGDPYRISGQLQQLPSPPGGGIFKREWFNFYEVDEFPTFEYILQSWDTALVGATSSKSPDTVCYSACTTWGIFRDQRDIPNVMLLSLFKGKLEYPELRKKVVELSSNYDYNNEYPFIKPKDKKCDLVLIESKGSGYTLVSELMSTGIPLMGFNPAKAGLNYSGTAKEARARRITDIIEKGLLWLPTLAPHHQHPNDYSRQLIKDCLLFPKGESNDTIDSMSQAFIRLKQSGFIYHPDDPTDDPKFNFKKKKNW